MANQNIASEFKLLIYAENLLYDKIDYQINKLDIDYSSYEFLNEMCEGLDPNVLTIGFARRFATYKRATLIFRDLERITKIFNQKDMPIQLIFAGKAHPRDKEGKDLIKYIHELSLKPQFKGKLFILENYNIGMSRYLVSGVDVWLNNPRRPLEASGTSGQKAAVNGAINFSILDGWWAEGYNQKNGWAIGTNAEYRTYEEQDDADAKSIYDTLENKIMPLYYNKNEKGYSEGWMEIMKNSISSNSGKYSTARMLQDYLQKLYIPQCDLTKEYRNLNNVSELNEWKNTMRTNFANIKITQPESNYDNIEIDAGNRIEVRCNVKLPKGIINRESIDVQVYYGKITENGIVDDIKIDNMQYDGEEKGIYKYKDDEKIANILDEIEDSTYFFKVLGSYPEFR